MTVRARSRAGLVGLGILAGLVVGLWVVLVGADAMADQPAATVVAVMTSTPPRAQATPTSAPSPTRTPMPTATSAAVPTSTRAPAATPTSPPKGTAAPATSPTPARSPTAVATVQRLAPVVVRGTASGVVALTFDLGGTEAGATAHVLDTLEAYGYHGTFFLTGQWTAANPALVRRIVAEGHEIANHTYDHPRLTEISADEMKLEIWSTELAIVKAAGVMPKAMLRPPFGSYNDSVRAVLGELGYDLIFWTVDSGDWRGFTPEQIVARAGTLKAGDIFVAHAYAANTGQAIEGICETISGNGLTGTTLSRTLGR